MQRPVLFFESHSGSFNGAQHSLYLLLKRLDRRRFRPILLGPKEGTLTHRLQEAGVQTIILRPKGRLTRYGGALLQEGICGKGRLMVDYLGYAARVRRIIKDEGIGVIHCNSIRSLLTVGPVARLSGVPCIWHLRLNLDLGMWNRMGLMLADRIIVVADSLREQFPIAAPRARRKFVTVYNGLDLAEWDRGDRSERMRHELGIEPGWQAVGTTGSLNPRKDQLGLLRAFSTLVRKRPRTKLVIVGDARGTEEQAYADRLRAYVAAEKIERNVTFTGWRSDVPCILRELDLFVLPSLNEGFPRSILEAMGLALPVVATRVGGNAELVVHRRTGLLVPPQDTDALASAILRILEDPMLACNMGTQGRRRVKDEFSLEASVRGVEAVIDGMLAARRDRSQSLGGREDAATSQILPPSLLAENQKQALVQPEGTSARIQYRHVSNVSESVSGDGTMKSSSERSSQTVTVVMPAYNAAKTLEKTYNDLPHPRVSSIILVDDGSSDRTVEIARTLNMRIFIHNRNYGYGANQKTCYAEALKTATDIVVMVHPDYQYDPTLLPLLIKPIEEGRAEVVLGSRLLAGPPTKEGMPWWKYLGNRFLTAVENRIFGLRLSEYHTGYRAYDRRVLEAVTFILNSDKFVFDQEIIAQIVSAGFRITEVPVRARYFPEASSASLLDSTIYGLSILWLLFRFLLHRYGLREQKQFEDLKARYKELPTRAGEQLGNALAGSKE